MLDPETTNIDERMAFATGHLSTHLSTLIEEALDHYKPNFPENPTIPYTITMDTLGAYIGQLINTFPKENRDAMIHHIVDVIMTAQYKLSLTESDTCSQIGHA